MFGSGLRLRSAAAFGAAVAAFVACATACGGAGRTEPTAHSATPVAVSTSASASADSSPTPSPSASANAASPSPTPSSVHSSAGAHGASGSSPKPAKTTAPTSPKLYASPTIAYGQIDFLSLTSGRLCVSIPDTVSDHGDGRIYSIGVSLGVAQWRLQTGKSTFPVAPHSSRSATFTVCTSGFTQPAGVCYSVYEGGVEYWGDPNPDMASIDAVTPGTGSLCIPRQP